MIQCYKYGTDTVLKFQLNMFTHKKVTNILLTHGYKHCRAPNET